MINKNSNSSLILSKVINMMKLLKDGQQVTVQLFKTKPVFSFLNFTQKIRLSQITGTYHFPALQVRYMISVRILTQTQFDQTLSLSGSDPPLSRS